MFKIFKEEWVNTVPFRRKESVDIFKNPNSKEWRECIAFRYARGVIDPKGNLYCLSGAEHFIHVNILEILDKEGLVKYSEDYFENSSSLKNGLAVASLPNDLYILELANSYTFVIKEDDKLFQDIKLKFEKKNPLFKLVI